MVSKSVRRPSPALIVAIVALVAALAGSAIALPGKNSVKKNDIAKNAVVSKAIKNNKVTGADVKESSLGKVPSAATADTAALATSAQLLGDGKVTRATPTSGASDDAARDAATKVPLVTVGAVTVYGKCYLDTSGPTLHADTYIETSSNRAIFDSGVDSLEGGALATDYLNTDTDETDREIQTDSVSLDGFDTDDGNFRAMGPDGSAFHGEVYVAMRHGSEPEADALVGSGDVCQWSADQTG